MGAKPNLLLFFAAMKALQNAELSSKYTWASSLISGALLTLGAPLPSRSGLPIVDRSHRAGCCHRQIYGPP